MPAIPRPLASAVVLTLTLAALGAAPTAATPQPTDRVSGRSVVTQPPALPLPAAPWGEAGEPAVGGGYHYGAAYTQLLPDDDLSRGVRASFSVHRPKQVKGKLGQHSVAQIAVGDSSNRAFVEAGWRQYVDGPRLFVYWRPADGSNTCYDFGCGFKDKGKGQRPGTRLEPGTRVTIGFRFSKGKWWLVVDGQKSGFYPAKLWDGQFTRSDYAQVYGEVFVDPSQPLCADMGNGKRAKRKKAASVRNVRFYGGPDVQLSLNIGQSDLVNYSLELTGDRSFRYGGPGAC